MPSRIKILFILCCITCCLYSCDDILVEDISREKIMLVAPTDNAVSGDTLQQFAWEHIGPLADYQVQIVHPTFDSIAVLVEDTILSDNLLKVPLKNGRQYQWRVRALNSSFSSAYSRPWTLTIQ